MQLSSSKTFFDHYHVKEEIYTEIVHRNVSTIQLSVLDQKTLIMEFGE